MHAVMSTSVLLSAVRIIYSVAHLQTPLNRFNHVETLMEMCQNQGCGGL